MPDNTAFASPCPQQRRKGYARLDRCVCVCAMVRRRHDGLHCSMAFKHDWPFRPSYTAPQDYDTSSKRRRGPLLNVVRGLPEQHHFACGVLERRVKRRVGIGPAMSPSRSTRHRHFEPVVSPWGNTRPGEHSANASPRFLASGLPRSLAEKHKNLL